MLSKNELKYIQSLCQKKQRAEEGLFIAEGPKLAEEILNSDFAVKKIYATNSWQQLHAGIPNIVTVTEAELSRMSALQTAKEVLMVCYQKKMDRAPVFKGRLTLLLDGIQDPGNLGTIIRIADWFGISQIVASEDTVELYNPKVIQSTMGSFIRVNCWYQDPEATLQACQVPVYGAMLQGNDLYQTGKIKEGILVIGNESKGIREQMLPFIQHSITIPRIGQAESLNAAVATGIILSHVCG